MSTPASGLFTGFVDGGHLLSASSSFPGFLRGCTFGTSGYGAGFPGYTVGGKFSGVFTGYVCRPASAAAIGVFTGFTPGGGNYIASQFPGFVYNANTAASGVFTGYTRGYGTTQGAVPASGFFTGYVKRNTSSSFYGFVQGPRYASSGLFTAYTVGSTQSSGVFTGYTASHGASSGLFVGFTSGF